MRKSAGRSNCLGGALINSINVNQLINLFTSLFMNQTTELITELADKYGRSRENLLPILQGVVERENYLSDHSMIEIARELDLSAAEVYGTATFTPF